MKNSNYYFLLLLIIIISSACSKEPCEVIVQETSPSFATNITGINVALKQAFSEEGSFIILECSTQDVYECNNYTIEYELEKKGRTFYIHFNQAAFNQGCITGEKPAFADIELPKLDEHVYDIRFTLNGNNTSTLLAVGSKEVLFGSDKPTVTNANINITNHRMLLIPKHLIWGEVYFYNDYSDAAYDMLEQFVATGAAVTILPPGRYANCFDVLENNQVVFNDTLPPANASKIPFLYTYEGNTQTIINIFKTTMDNNKISPTSPAILGWINDTKGISFAP